MTSKTLDNLQHLTQAEKKTLSIAAGKYLKEVRDNNWPNNTLAMAYKLIEEGYPTKSSADSLETQLRRWFREGISLKKVPPIAKALNLKEEDFIANTTQTTLTSEAYQKRTKILTLSTILLACTLVVAITAYILKPKPLGEIHFPPENAQTTNTITVTGTTQNIPEDKHTWLVVEINGNWWAKREVRPNTEFSTVIEEKGKPPKGRYTLSLYQVDKNLHQRIKGWIKGGKVQDDYPGKNEKLAKKNKLDSTSLILKIQSDSTQP